MSEHLEIYHLTLPLYVTSQRNHMKYDSTVRGRNKEQSNDNKIELKRVLMAIKMFMKYV